MKLHAILLTIILIVPKNYASQEVTQQIIDIESNPFLTQQTLSRVSSNNIINESDHDALLPKPSEIKSKKIQNIQIPICCACCILCYSCIATTILSACDRTKQR